MRAVVCGLLFLLMSVLDPTLVAAGERLNSYLEGSTRKLGRGFCNLVTAPLELIRTPHLITQQEGGFAGATVGVVQGVGAVVIRELAGALELVTFFVPFPNSFNPILKPEFLYANGDWVP
jgi:putative exosortase-associated protein (TIGR04073 family)